MTTFTLRTPLLRILRSARATVLAAASPRSCRSRPTRRANAATCARSDSGARGPKALPGWSCLRSQDYICLPSGASFAWTLFGPQATLFHNDARQIMTHFLSPNPDEAGTLRGRGSTRVDSARCGQGQSPRPRIPRLRCAGRDPMAPARSRGSGKRTHRRQKADGADPHSAAEHGGRDRSGNRLFTVGECRDRGLRPGTKPTTSSTAISIATTTESAIAGAARCCTVEGPPEGGPYVVGSG